MRGRKASKPWFSVPALAGRGEDRRAVVGPQPEVGRHALQVVLHPLLVDVGRVEALDQQALPGDLRRQIAHVRVAGASGGGTKDYRTWSTRAGTAAGSKGSCSSRRRITIGPMRHSASRSRSTSAAHLARLDALGQQVDQDLAALPGQAPVDGQDLRVALGGVDDGRQARRPGGVGHARWPPARAGR